MINLNAIANDPDVYPFVMANCTHRADLSEFAADPANHIVGDERGVVLLQALGHGFFQWHYLFTKRLRGREALAVARTAIRDAFTLLNARAIYGLTPRENRAARLMNRALGAVPVGTSLDPAGRECIEYRLERAQWDSSAIS